MDEFTKKLKDTINSMTQKGNEAQDEAIRKAQEDKAKELQAQGKKPEQVQLTPAELAKLRQREAGPAERSYKNESVKARVREAAKQDRSDTSPKSSQAAKPIEKEATRMELSPGLQRPPDLNGPAGPGGVTYVNPRARRRESLADQAERHARERREAIAAMTPEQKAEHDRQEGEKRDHRRTNGNSGRGRGSSDHSEGRGPEEEDYS